MYLKQIGNSEALSFNKYDIRDLLDLFSNDKGALKSELVEKWRFLIIYAVNCMRRAYTHCMDARREYYNHDWQEIEAANNIGDFKALTSALEGLRSSITYE